MPDVSAPIHFERANIKTEPSGHLEFARYHFIRNGFCHPRLLSGRRFVTGEI